MKMKIHEVSTNACIEAGTSKYHCTAVYGTWHTWETIQHKSGSTLESAALAVTIFRLISLAPYVRSVWNFMIQDTCTSAMHTGRLGLMHPLNTRKMVFLSLPEDNRQHCSRRWNPLLSCTFEIKYLWHPMSHWFENGRAGGPSMCPCPPKNWAWSAHRVWRHEHFCWSHWFTPGRCAWVAGVCNSNSGGYISGIGWLNCPKIYVQMAHAYVHTHIKS